MNIKDTIIAALRKNVTMRDTAMVALFVTFPNPLDGYTALMELVKADIVIMSDLVDATGRTIGGVYSLPSTKMKG